MAVKGTWVNMVMFLWQGKNLHQGYLLAVLSGHQETVYMPIFMQL